MNFPRLNPFKRSKTVARGRLLAHQMGRDPYADWMMILAVSLMVAVALIGTGVSTYVSMGAKLVASSQPKTATASTIDTDRLTRVLGQWNDRTAESLQVVRGYSGPGDPSM
ncbi:MAG: hypothetical protein KGI59_01120 [Patescibacteria group bacterium]|nr:hypothetical protein [Patescibacteria group bacterium]